MSTNNLTYLHCLSILWWSLLPAPSPVLGLDMQSKYRKQQMRMNSQTWFTNSLIQIRYLNFWNVFFLNPQIDRQVVGLEQLNTILWFFCLDFFKSQRAEEENKFLGNFWGRWEFECAKVRITERWPNYTLTPFLARLSSIFLFFLPVRWFKFFWFYFVF